jgi:hypothetical protein
MQDARKHQRIRCHLPVDLFCGNQPKRLICRSQNICLGGMFAVGAQCMRVDDPVHVELAPESGSTLHLEGRVARTTTDGAGLEFVDNSPATMEVLGALLSPNWDGGFLLDGVIKIAPWYRDNDLAGWMRLTSIVSDWQHLTHR